MYGEAITILMIKENTLKVLFLTVGARLETVGLRSHRR